MRRLRSAGVGRPSGWGACCRSWVSSPWTARRSASLSRLLASRAARVWARRMRNLRSVVVLDRGPGDEVPALGEEWWDCLSSAVGIGHRSCQLDAQRISSGPSHAIGAKPRFAPRMPRSPRAITPPGQPLARPDSRAVVPRNLGVGSGASVDKRCGRSRPRCRDRPGASTQPVDGRRSRRWQHSNERRQTTEPTAAPMP